MVNNFFKTTHKVTNADNLRIICEAPSKLLRNVLFTKTDYKEH